MEISVLFFGQLAELTGTNRIAFMDVPDTDVLHQLVKERFPQLHKQRFATAVNRKIITKKTPLSAATEVALLPPFSGG